MAKDAIRMTDGSFDWSGGVDSSKVTTIQSTLTPNGLRRDQLSWLNNATVRRGGILQRTGWQPNGRVADGTELFQGGFLYEPKDGSNPYFIIGIGGRILQYIPDTAVLTDLSAMFGEYHPANVDKFFFAQGEEFLVIQAGDLITLPLFWDGAILRRSIGVNIAATPGQPGISEIPSAGAMVYHRGRLWYAQGRNVNAGDIILGASGTAAYSFRDAILNVTENPLCVGGDGFAVPTNAGNIRALAYTANINTQLGQGPLYIFTRKSIYQLDVPVTRADWIAANADQPPVMTVVQINNGSVNDRSIAAVNGDLFYQSLEPAVRSLTSAVRNFQQWGNKPISNNEERALQFNDRALMRFASGIQFDNRMLQAILPKQVGCGVVHQAILPLDFDIINSLDTDLPPSWEGMYEGLKVLQLFSGDFSGLERAFAAMVSDLDGSINVWELTRSSRTENGDDRVTWQVEFPAFTWGHEFDLKELDGLEMWMDKVFGEVHMQFFYRQDADPCWKLWFDTSFCSARNCEEDVNNPVCYPISPSFHEGYRFPIVAPKPKAACDSMSIRPTNIGFQFQLKVVIKGWCRIRGLILYALPVERGMYERLSC